MGRFSVSYLTKINQNQSEQWLELNRSIRRSARYSYTLYIGYIFLLSHILEFFHLKKLSAHPVQIVWIVWI